MNLLPIPVAFILGVLIGGLLNALADDLPRRKPLAWPHYADGERRPPTAWLGVLAFALGQRASSKGSRLGWRHPLTELITGLLFVVVVIKAGEDPDMTAVRLAFVLFYVAVLVLITVIDIEHRLILFVTIVPTALVAILDALLEPLGPSLVDALIGGAVGFGVFYLLYRGGFLFVAVSNQIRERKLNTVAFGYGDVMLMTVVGLMLGWQPLILVMFMTVFIGAFGGIVWLIGRAIADRSYSWFTPLPYGPYIVIAASLMLLYPSEITKLLMGL